MRRENPIEGHCQIVSERAMNTRLERLGRSEALQVSRIAIHDQYQWAHLKGVCIITHGWVFSRTKLIYSHTIGSIGNDLIEGRKR